MAKDIQILKGYCPVSKKYYLLTLEKFGSEYKIVDMTVKSDQEAKSFVSTIRQDKFVTHENLIPCDTCHTRTIASCNCPKTKGKCHSRFFFQCCYCKNFQIVYDEISGTMGEIKVGQGDVIDLSKLRSASGGRLEKISFAGGWDVATGRSNDVDFSCLLLGPSSEELIFYGNKSSSNQSVKHYGDNLTGAAGAVAGMVDDDEQIDVDLKKVSSEYNEIYFFLNIYSADERGQTFNTVKNLYLRMFDKDRKLLSYKISQDVGNHTGLIAAKLARKGDGWEFEAIGKYIKASYANDIVKMIKGLKRQ